MADTPNTLQGQSTINCRMMAVDETGQWVPLRMTENGINMTIPPIPDGDKGDITVTNDGGTWTIDNNTITTDKLVDEAVTTAKIDDDAVTGAKIADNTITNAHLQQNVIQYNNITTAATVSLQRKNRVINGNMRINQRTPTASGAATTDGGYTVDRFLVSRGGSYGGTLTWTYDTAVPSFSGTLFNFTHSLKLSTTQDTTPGTDGYCFVSTRIEGYDISDLIDTAGNMKDFTLSFWTRNSRAGTYCVFLKNSAVTRTYTKFYSVTANTWTQVTMTVAASAVGGVWVNNNGIGLSIGWTLVSGTDFDDGVDSTWVSSNEFCNSSQQNWADVASDFWLTGVQLEPGTSATNFEFRPFQQELALCQRYYEKSYGLDTAPGTATSSGRIICSSGTNLTGTNQFWAGTSFKATKRITPTTLTIYDQSTNSAKVTGLTAAGGTVNNVAYALAEAHSNGINIALSNTSYAGFIFHFTADSEL